VLTAGATAGIVSATTASRTVKNLAGGREIGRQRGRSQSSAQLRWHDRICELQIAFLGAVTTGMLAKTAGTAIDFSSVVRRSRQTTFTRIAWMANLLFLTRSSDRAAPASTYTATTSQALYGMQRKHKPAEFRLGAYVYGVPRVAMWFNLAASFVFLFFFRGWGTRPP